MSSSSSGPETCTCDNSTGGSGQQCPICKGVDDALLSMRTRRAGSRFENPEALIGLLDSPIFLRDVQKDGA